MSTSAKTSPKATSAKTQPQKGLQSKAQAKSSTSSEGFAFGNLDKDQKSEIPEHWLDDEDSVIVKQEKLIKVDGKIQAVPHEQPVQVYARKMYAQNMVPDEKSGRTGFDDMAIRVTVLHDAKATETKEITKVENEKQIDLIKQTVGGEKGTEDGDEPDETNPHDEPAV